MLNNQTQEKLITSLLKRPENQYCSDCNGKSPCCNQINNQGASLDFGVFVCMNCSGAHRALGPSITRVKSTKLDTWKKDWLQNMKIGNSILNQYWEKPNAHSTLNQIRKYVFDKYVKRKFADPNEQFDPLTKLKKGIAFQKPEKDQGHQKPKEDANLKQDVPKQIKMAENPQVKGKLQSDLLVFNQNQPSQHCNQPNELKKFNFSFQKIQPHKSKHHDEPTYNNVLLNLQKGPILSQQPNHITSQNENTNTVHRIHSASLPSHSSQQAQFTMNINMNMNMINMNTYPCAMNIFTGPNNSNMPHLQHQLPHHFQQQIPQHFQQQIPHYFQQQKIHHLSGLNGKQPERNFAVSVHPPQNITLEVTMKQKVEEPTIQDKSWVNEWM